MKQSLLVFFIGVFLLSSFSVFSQGPSKINFQAILRNKSGDIVSNQAVGVRMSIKSGTINNSSLYVETHTKTTDVSGLINIQLGTGTVISGIFGDIEWGSGSHFIQLEVDFNGGSNYVVIGTQELISVPYALYANKTDTSVLNLRNRFSEKVNVGDTSNMLTNYWTGLNLKLSISDTSNMLFNYRTGLTQKVNLSDTALMLEPYLQYADTTNMLVPYLREADTTNMLVPYLRDADTTNMLVPYLRDADTTNMLLPYLRDADTTNMLVPYLRDDDTTNMLVPYLLDADTTNMLVPYLRDADTTNMLLPYLRDADTTNMLVPYLLDADTTNMLVPYLRDADTTNMLVPYLRDADTTNMLLPYLRDVDTTNMLLPYLQDADTTNMLVPYLRDADTTNMLVPYLRDADTTNMLVPYLRDADTTNMLVPYLRDADTTNMLNSYFKKLDTTSLNLTNRFNGKLNVTDFPRGTTTGNIMFYNGTSWLNLAPGSPGQSLIISSSGLPTWGCIITNTAGSPSSSPSLVVNTALTPITISTTGATGIGAATGLPTGVTASWSNNVITISGTPSLAASFTYTIPLTGGCGSVNATGTITVTVLPCNPSTVTDVDGNSYNTVLIGNQCWTIENLKVRRYNDNTWIQFDASGGSSGSTSNTWNGITVGAHTIYAHDSTTNNPSNLTKYGYLYNWYAAAGIITTGGSPTKNICPLNWHVPTIDEWNTLIDYIGGTNGAGSKMKSTSSLWTSQSPVPDNSTGFTVLPGGHRFTNSAFSGIGTNAYFWSSTSHPDVRYALTKSFIYNSGNVVNTDYGYGGNKFVGSSIRCIRNSNLTTTSIGSITSTGASSGGNFTFDDGATITARGVVWSTSSGPTVSLSTKTTDGTGTGTFTSTISGLSASTTYYVRAYATNTAGTAYGNEVTFITTCTLNTAGAASSTPTLNAYSALTPITISTTGATGIGTPTGLPTGVSASWAANTITISGIPSVTGTFTYTIPLTGGCGSGVNATGTITVNVFTCATNSFSDIDGNTYNTVSIGAQCWMSENLKTSRYRNGDLIPIVTDNTAWGNNLQTAQTGKRSWYNNDSTTYENRYGNLYNWYAVVDSRGLCPTGWHVSSDDEWKTLTGINGVGSSEPGRKLKSTVTNSMQGSGLGWDPGNPGTDNYGFSAFPGGLRSKEGVFNSIRTDAFFWCATQSNTTTAWGRYLSYNNTTVYAHDLGLKEVGASVRCLKD